MTEYKYPFSLDKQLPDLSDLIKALKKAEAKDLAYRDVRPLMALLDRLESVDPRLPGHIRKRKSALMSVPWDIITEDENYSEEVYYIKLRLLKAIKTAQKHYTTQKLFGKFCIGMEWDIINSNWTPVTFNIPQPWDTEAYPLFEIDVALLNHEGFQVTRIELEEKANYSWLTDIDNKPHSPGGTLRSILFWEWLLYADIKDWRNFNKRAKGLAVATYQGFSAATENAQATSEKAVKQLGDVNWASVPDSIKFEFLKAVDAVAASSYPNFKNAIQEDIAVAIRGTGNTSSLQDKGAKAAVQTLFDVEETIAYNDRVEFEEMINDQLIKQDWARNYSGGETTEVPWRFAWIIKEAEDAERNVRIVDTMLRSGIPLYKSEIAEKTGFNPATEEEIIEPKQTGGLF